MLLSLALAGCAASGVSDITTGVLRTPLSSSLHPEDLRMSCSDLAATLRSDLESARALPAAARSERASAAPTLAEVLARGFGGPGSGLRAVADYGRQRTRIEALDQLMEEKRCSRIDFQRDLQAIEADFLVTT